MTSATDIKKWPRVNKHRPCPVCGRPDWCLVAPNGGAAICARVESGHVVGTKGAGWLHPLDGKPMPPPVPQAKGREYPRAPVQRRDAVYSALLDALPLTPGHGEHLAGRGLTPAEIAELHYRSLPQGGRHAIVRQLRAQGLKLAGVPGFGMDRSEVSLFGASGILLPVRDIAGRIQGLQVRADHPRDGSRYRWLSSAGRVQGSSPGVPVHVSRPKGADGSEVWITEGPIKADIAAFRLNRIVLAVAGVGNWHDVPSLVHKLEARRVVIAFDMDKNWNSAVRLHMDGLIARLADDGVRVFEADWNTDFKGIDDLVTGRP